MEETKTCTKCGRNLPLSEFNKCKGSKDGLQSWCKECKKQYRADNAEHIKQHKKQYRTDNPEYMKQYNKQYYADNPEYFKQYRADNREHNKQWRADNAEHIKQYKKQYYATIEGYAYYVRFNNLQKDRKYGRCGNDEDILPPLEYYIEKLSEGIDYYDGKHYPFNELGFDRIDNSKPHTIDNMVVATTEHNIDRWYKHMTVEEYKELMKKLKGE